jgi:hypothetical protein
MKERIGIITTVLIAGVLLALINVIEFKTAFIITGILLTYEAINLFYDSYKKLLIVIKFRQFKKWHGKEFTATISGQELKGLISIESTENGQAFAYLCFDETIIGAESEHDYAVLEDKQGFKHAWFIGFGDKDSLNIAGIENLIIKK